MNILFLAPIIAKIGDNCKISGGDFLGFPAWYKYLGGREISTLNPRSDLTICAPQVSSLSDIWLIAAAILELLLRVAALAAVALVIWGGFQFVTSQGDPAGTQKARKTIINALIGLVIAIAAATLVSFIAGRFS